ncbi:unnamed protein product [Cyclocybe aegerita]|uniref:O-methyltransferase C-terminal domain-containing protein n=1 Tax=Cyclocybe aegerita TaxID=1973307 RepID=A0A8S0WA15_CYCAE|nr:unnamed protein product [Cyclocybe aegerita]
MSDQLTALSSLISNGITEIAKKYAERGQSYPILADPAAGDGIMDDADITKATNTVLAAAAQLIETLRKPADVLMDTVYAMHTTSALRVAVETGIAELLREAGPDGLHIKVIGDKVGVDGDKLGRCLRFLSARHIFKELAPDVFANNRHSAVLDTGKPYEAIQNRPLDRFENAQRNMAAFVSHASAEPFAKGAMCLTDYLLDPESSFSIDPAITPVSRGHGQNIAWFEYIEQPGNERLLKNMGAAMAVSASLFPKELVLSTFDWDSLKKGDLVVDVGGGIGSCTLPLAQGFLHLRYVIQDRPSVIPQGFKYWASEFPAAIETGMVQLQAHDFFQPQPIKDASVFLLRFVIHDWADKYAKEIMCLLRASATPRTKLLLLEFVVPYTCNAGADGKGKYSYVPGAEDDQPPYPLLPSMGPVSSHVYFADLRMMANCNSPERTIGQWVDLAEGTGWKLESVKKGALSALVYGVA